MALTAEQKQELLEKYKIANDIVFYTLSNDPDVPKDRIHSPLDEDTLEEMVDDPETQAVYEKAQALKALANEFPGSYYAEEIKTLPADFQRFAYLDLDLSYTEPGNESKKDEIIRKNKEKIRSYQDPANQKEFIQKYINKLQELDFSKIYTASPEELCNFYKENMATLKAGMLLRKDILVFVEKENPSILTESQKSWARDYGGLLEEYGALESKVELMASGYYPLLKDHVDDYTSLTFGIETYVGSGKLSSKITGDDVRDPEAPGLTIPDKAYLEFTKALNAGYLTIKYESHLKDSGKVVPFMKSQGVLGGEYAPQAGGEAIELHTAVSKLAKGEEVQFVKMTSDPANAETKTFHGMNPVSPSLKAINDTEKSALAEAWFESLKTKLGTLDGDDKFDLENRFEAYRLHSFEVTGPEFDKLTQVSNVIGNPHSKMDYKDYLDDSKTLNQFTTEEKIKLYDLARNGQLAIYSNNSNPNMDRLIYIDDNNQAGISATLEGMAGIEPLHNMLNENPDYAKELFPNAKNAEALAESAASFSDSRNLALTHKATPEDEVRASKQSCERLWETYLAADMRDNPDYYTDPALAVERSKMIEMTAKSDLSNRMDEWKKYESYGTDHPLTQASEMRKALKPFADKLGISVEDMITSGYITKGPNGLYDPIGKDQGSWELTEALVSDMINDEKIYLATPEVDAQGVPTGKLEYYKLGYGDDGPKIKPATKVKTEEMEQTLAILHQFKDSLDKTGVTKGDSAEFNTMKNTLNSVIDTLSVDNFSDVYKEQMSKLYSASTGYFMAKADQSKNTRREARFTASAALRKFASNIISGGKATDIQNYKGIHLGHEVIAAKIVKERMVSSYALAKKNGEKSKERQLAEALKNPASFNFEMKKIMGTEAFKAMVETKDGPINIKDLDKLARKSSSDLLNTYVKVNKKLDAVKSGAQPNVNDDNVAKSSGPRMKK